MKDVKLMPDKNNAKISRCYPPVVFELSKKYGGGEGGGGRICSSRARVKEGIAAMPYVDIWKPVDTSYNTFVS